MRLVCVSAALMVTAASYVTLGPSMLLAASDIVVGSNQRRTYDCRGGSATVEGGLNVVTFRNCTEITVEGGDNTIDAGLVDVLEVSGADNKITWTESADGRRPRITNEGLGNVISSKRAAAGTVRPPAPASGAAPADRVTISGDGVKVQGSGGSVTVGTEHGGTITIKEEPAGASRSGGRAAPAAGKIRIDQDGRKEDHDCRGASAVVNGDRNDLTFRNCDQVTLNGNANIVAVRAVKTVLVNGGDNKLTWEQADDGSRPKITDNGRGNTVSGKR